MDSNSQSGGRHGGGDLVTALQQIARQRTRNESPLLAVQTFAKRAGVRISHLPIHQHLEQAWIRVVGEPFHQHQALALASLRRGEPLALMGGASAEQTLSLLLTEYVRDTSPSTALVLVPDDLSATHYAADLVRLTAALPEPLRVGIAAGAGVRNAMAAQVIVATPAMLHQRLLRHHDRAWMAFWSRLRTVVLLSAHAYTGVAAAHLEALLLRVRRLSPAGASLQYMATMAPVTGGEEALATMSRVAWRVISAHDTLSPEVTLAVWRTGAERMRDLVALTLGLARTATSLHVTCPPFELALVQSVVGQDEPAVSLGLYAVPADVQIFPSLSGVAASLRAALDRTRLIVLMLGDDPAEHMLVRMAMQDQFPLLDGQPPAWIVAPGNSYIEAQHLLCAASEQPLQVAEVVEEWQSMPIVQHLQQQGRLRILPGSAQMWQPAAGPQDPYAAFTVQSVEGEVARLVSPQGADLGSVTMTLFDRWGAVNAVLPPFGRGYRVLERDDVNLVLTLSTAYEARRTMPLRRCSVHVRERREQRVIRGLDVAWGRVTVDEEIYALREVNASNAITQVPLAEPIMGKWTAPALWIDLVNGIIAEGQVMGWSLVMALPLATLASIYDLVPAYDEEARRLYFVDTEAGGNGVAYWLYQALETLLPLAYDIVNQRGLDPLFEPVARADKDWLLALLAGGQTVAPPQPRSVVRPQSVPPLPPQSSSPARSPNRPTAIPPTDVRRAVVSPPPPPGGEASVRGASGDPPAPVREGLPGPLGGVASVRGVSGEPPAPVRQELPGPPGGMASDEPPASVRQELPGPPGGMAPDEPPVSVRQELPGPPGGMASGEPPASVRQELPGPPGGMAPDEPPVSVRQELPGPPGGMASGEPPASVRQELPGPPGGVSGPGSEASLPIAPGTPADKPDQERESPPPPRTRSSGKARTSSSARKQPKSDANAATPEEEGTAPSMPRSRRADQSSRPRTQAGEPSKANPPASPPARPVPPQEPPAPPQEPPPVMPDAAAMVERLRRMRQQQEAQKQNPTTPSLPSSSRFDPIEPRFLPGDQVLCNPYGEGEVLASRIEDNREILVVAFPIYGHLTIDAIVSAVRLVQARS
ncbi:hypothetical protein EYB53_003995 [Candidatus Chloroploca sp. M-50]|uniref:Uncharacterized protein n=1 Tax=Candidatus Chloroploca mongolica TaxID=2528176 RepID=A0ABS4D602_9CHLR|nr:hypothetical protein [Candidatus Chloroploca mongolica]MBP1464866.1 hypothetical protein [Candidatus Chloroploca mongolica]